MKMFFLIALSVSIGAVAAPPELNLIFKDKTAIENPIELRDPFKAPLSKSGTRRAESTGDPNYTLTNGVYSNLKDADLSTVNIQNLKVVGVLIGKERRVMVQYEGSSEVSILKEGMKLGVDKAELKAILPGGIILVEKIINVYGQEEYLETVIPISR